MTYVMRPRAVPVTWTEIHGNWIIYSTAVVATPEAFGLCAPVIEGLGRGNAGDPPPPKTLYTPGLVTQLGCGLVRTDAAGRNAWYSWRGAIVQPVFGGVHRRVLAALAGK